MYIKQKQFLSNKLYHQNTRLWITLNNINQLFIVSYGAQNNLNTFFILV